MSANKVELQAFIDQHPFSPFQWRVFALCFGIVLLDGFDTAAIGYVAPSLLSEWGLSKPDLAPVLSAALFGLATGALLAGPLADRIGRKRVLIGSVLLLGLFCLASSYAASLDTLVVLRFATGIGLGAAMPCAVTMMSEFAPTQRRAMLTNAMFCGFPLGAALGGFLASWLIPLWGWRSVLMLGGIAPLLLVLVLILLMPESVRYMVSRGAALVQIRAVLGRISHAAHHLTEVTLAETSIATAGQQHGVALVLSSAYRMGSLMLWLSYFMGLVIFYALINWMPLMFKEAGIDPQQAVLIAALFPLGGLGAIACGWLMDRFNADRIIAVGYLLTALAIFAIGQSINQLGLLVVVVFIAGSLMNTAQSSLPALAASFYPTQGRATGVAWMLGIGRFGGIAGSFLVAELQRQQLAVGEVFTVLAVPALLAAAALFIKLSLKSPGQLPRHGAAPRSEDRGARPVVTFDNAGLVTVPSTRKEKPHDH
ncbi:MFS transporter [Aeromonas cavernicola]|uniref:Aromatic acid/H+ symport family MFS transporter n=1 Tax=Aeromonas cavernicola TaxID=1006623 RepID=A0A2H9U2R3_9GAMM|nr:MFS transporter [Aeromonas cavernicola]PJG58304.1 aromatic acid/H+ symport family MFS transporter [Aeromonas cavernicola]